MKNELKSCPFCGAIPIYFDDGDYKIKHFDHCFLLYYDDSFWIFKRCVEAWETRI